MNAQRYKSKDLNIGSGGLLFVTTSDDKKGRVINRDYKAKNDGHLEQLRVSIFL